MVCTLERRGCGPPSQPSPPTATARSGSEVRRDRPWTCRLRRRCRLPWRRGLPLHRSSTADSPARPVAAAFPGVLRTQRGSRNRTKAVRALAREHHRIANIRRSFLHEVSRQLAQTHSGLAVEDLPAANLIRNRHLARAITDAAWAEFARQLRYKTAWLGGELVVCYRWFPSTKTCSACGRVAERLALRTRTFHCGACGLVMDRDRNAAANLAAWAERATIETARVPDRQAGGWVTHAPGGEGAGHRFCGGETGPCEGGTNAPASAGVKDTREGWRPTTSKRPVDAL